jgi:hypothetical protein
MGLSSPAVHLEFSQPVVSAVLESAQAMPTAVQELLQSASSSSSKPPPAPSAPQPRGAPTAAISSSSSQTGGLESSLSPRDLAQQMSAWSSRFLSLSGVVGADGSVGSSVVDPRILSLIGRWGEALVYQILLHRESTRQAADPASPPRVVTWVNRDVESGLPYDLIYGSATSADGDAESEYIEVKSTVHGDRHTFDISAAEVSCALARRQRYAIWRVSHAGSTTRAAYTEVHNPALQWHEKKIRVWMEL